MRIIPFLLSALITLGLVFALNTKWGAVPPLGKFLSPQQGFWQNAEPVSLDMAENLTFDSLQGDVNVYMDDRLVPHIFAEQEYDAYFVQGYLHAKYRLWQMEFQTHAAAGRISEVLGNNPDYLRYDREQRRLGMVYGAENALKAMESDPFTRSAVNAYTSGVNAYINSLTESRLPIEYKLLDYKPEQWTPLKVGLFLKAMSKTLSGYERDLEFTNAKSVFSTNELNILYPQLSDSSVPIVPNAKFDTPAIKPRKPITADSLYFNWDTTVKAREVYKPNRRNGSNNWAVSGAKTASGAPILCNDPHLSFSLPSIWYEMQISTPTMNVYGATFPGSPSVIIGYNDSIAFGVTNAGRDVKDYYKIRFRDASKSEYWFQGAWTPATKRIEHINVRGAAIVQDTVAYTVFGPVMYDEDFTRGDSTNHTALAVRWTAHDVSNEALTFLKLNRAKNYADYLDAIKDYTCPAQNILYASKRGAIALWQQGRFPALWQGQGLYIMPGEDSSYRWQGFIPQAQNPHLVNPPEGFIESANQRPVDSSYPYFIPGSYAATRGRTISNRLSQMQGITPEDMMQLQNDIYDGFAATATPLLLKYVDAAALNEREKRYVEGLSSWDYNARAATNDQTIFDAWWDSLYQNVWADDVARIPQPAVPPDQQTLLEMLLRDSSIKYIDNSNTPEQETLSMQVTDALHKASGSLQQREQEGRLAWWKENNASIYHLLRTAVLPFGRVGLEVGGTGNAINAIKGSHGPSWRMIVHLTTPTEAYGVYPGGQSGNPGSRFYDSFVDTWAAGKYYTLWMMKPSEKNDKRIIGTFTFSKS
jgi:penicillin amidase